MTDADYIEGMQPEQHVRRAAEYVYRADEFVRTSEDQINLGHHDEHHGRIVDSLTRLATVHLQMASTKSLLNSMPAHMGTSLHQLMEEYNASLHQFKPEGTVTGRLHDHGSRLPASFTMVEWRAIKEYIHHHLEDDGFVAHAIPGGNKFLGEKMIQTTKLWAETYGQHVEYAVDNSVPGTEPLFKAWVRGSKNAPTNQYGETEAEVLGPEKEESVEGD